VPKAGLEYIRKYREVKYQEAIFELVAKQYELARLDESKDAWVVQTLDRAVPPDRKSRPKRTLIVIFTGMFAGFVSVLAALVCEHFLKSIRDIRQGDKFSELSNYLLGRRNY
jgi:uncharacterized protein involved in exopolysaccharide biosynthesis